ncbi:MAG: PAS domain S-box protein [Gammaproteobacteria bacterium]|nr:PAS domain S-box protein [Gammaproteobacteria bacterium]MBU1777712.1 PAS domain S-box protein [Gammaproteobacteria bacterium]MBU1969267.1 PAS domain S-box protein [Gammaproteobacteria bacterium]
MNESLMQSHAYCFPCEPWLTAALLLGNLLIVLAYFSIPLAILRFISKRRDIDYRYLHWLFAAFIVSCGITHLLHLVALWYPVPYLEAAMDLMTGIISLVAAVAIWKLLPVFIAMPSTHQLQAARELLLHTNEALTESEAQLHALGDNLPDSYLYQYTLDGDKPRFLYISSGVERVHGLKVGDVLRDAMALLGRVDPDQIEAYFTLQVASQRDLGDFEMEIHVQSVSGEWRWMQLKSHPQQGKDGKVIWNGVATDVTDRHLLQTEINRLAQAIEQNPTGVLITDLQGTLLFMNQASTRICGYQFADLYGRAQSLREIISTEMSDAEYALVEERLHAGNSWSGVMRNRHRSGRLYWEQVTVAPLYDDNGKVTNYLFLRADVTGQKEAETTRTQLAAIVESSSDAIIGKTTDGIITHWNKGAERIYGYAAEEVIGKSITLLAARRYHAEISEFLQTVGKGGTVENHETERIRKDGALIHVALAISPIKDAAGRVVGISTIARDITERKRAEEEIFKLNLELERRVTERTAQLEAANKELEAFSYSVSHDLRTPLRAIDGFSKILLDGYADKVDEEGKRLLRVVRNNTGRMEHLIDDILQFSRTGRVGLSFATVDMEQLARGVVAELKAADPAGKAQIEIGALPPARGDSAMMRQVFVNLLANAIKFSRERESPLVEVGAEVKSGETVYHVRDNGVGFDMRFADKLFGVFQRLHSVSEFEGTGIGLAIVNRIVTRHGGRVWAEGKVNEGATIFFSLPRGEENGKA